MIVTKIVACLGAIASASLCNPYTTRATVINARPDPNGPKRPVVDIEIRCPWQAEIPIEVFRPVRNLLIVRPFPEVQCDLILGNNTYSFIQWTLDFTPVHFPPTGEVFRARVAAGQVTAVEVNAQFLALDANARNRAVTLGYFIWNNLETDVQRNTQSLIPLPAEGAIGAIATLLPRTIEGFVALMVGPHSTLSNSLIPAAAFQEVCLSAGGQSELYLFVDVPLRGSPETAVLLEEADVPPVSIQTYTLAQSSPTPAARIGLRIRRTN